MADRTLSISSATNHVTTNAPRRGAWAAIESLVLPFVYLAVVSVAASRWIEPSLDAKSRLAALWVAFAFYVRTFQFFIGLAIAVAALISLCRRRWMRTAVAMLIAVCIASPEIVHALPAKTMTPPAAGRSVRVLSLNLLRGNDRMRDVIRAIQAECPDVICFQEYTHDQQAALLPALAGRFPYHVQYPSYEYQGLAVYARFPLTPEVAPDGGTPHARMMSVRLKIDGRDVRLANIHPTSPSVPSRIIANRQQVAWLIESLRADPATPTIIAGDCNWTLASQQADALRAAGFTPADDAAGSGLRWSWGPRQFGLPVARIDQVFSSRHFAAQSSRVLGQVGSDHRPVVADLAFRND